ncbi:interleukin-1 receptor type 1 isoform X1 [Scomber scombrus]|uniref:interleukin-1 receptor type 1 isoform X1 n=2 Tax=Scomber scombrus TaxID=13677 RepID=UPI002DD8363A|nr:interleukin-1 receptor type 1 isoform X1 [Scomber scombrus]
MAMGLASWKLGSLLFFLGLYGICSGSVHENCTNYKLQFERVYSVPGDVAMLNSTLVAHDVFDYTLKPYNITWYGSKQRGKELSNQPGRILLQGETLWFLNVTLNDEGEYITILRTSSGCYRQATKLIVDKPVAAECGRPQKANQMVTNGVTDHVSCPLKDYIKKLDSYNITHSLTWYKDCDRIVSGVGKFSYWDETKLKIDEVDLQDNGHFTCTLTFTLGGVTGSVSETIYTSVKEEYCSVPQVHEPANETIKAPIGSNFTKKCLVFVPCVGNRRCMVDIFWVLNDDFIEIDISERVYSSEERLWHQNAPIKGLWLEKLLIISELREEDYQINYTCRAYSDRGNPWGYFSLLPPDPCIIIPIGSALGSVMVLLISSVIVFYIFKIDIVLLFRQAFPILYTNKDLDGKLYDAYVAYPQPCAVGFSEEVEMFAIHMLPEVLEKACGYKLFIAGRDCLPGQAVVDSVHENIQASRRLLLLYTASTFISKSHTGSVSSHNNNNVSKDSDGINNNESKTGDNINGESLDGGDGDYLDTRQQLECLEAMYKALMEGSLKVVLVELEEVTPAQLALFPESVRHLRKKQGAVRWWKNQRTRQRWKTCTRREDEEKGRQDAELSPSLSPSSRFWKEMKYHMPVRGKRAVYPEKTALL